MGIQFAKLMGNIKEIEVGFLTLSVELDKSFAINFNTAQHLIQSLKEISSSTSTVNNKNITEIKEKFKNILQINKNELSQPLKAAKKNFEQLEHNLNKIVEKIKCFNEKSQSTSLNTTSKSKTIIQPEENITLEHAISELLCKFDAYKQQLNVLFDNLMTVQHEINGIKKAINLYDYSNEEVKLSKHIAYFANKFRTIEHTINTNTLLIRLKNLQTNIIQSDIDNSTSSTNVTSGEQANNKQLLSQPIALDLQDHHSTLLTQFEKSTLPTNQTNNSESDSAELADLENSLGSTNSINDFSLTTLFNQTMSPRISPRLWS